jgi:hypothetical protein
MSLPIFHVFYLFLFPYIYISYTFKFNFILMKLNLHSIPQSTVHNFKLGVKLIVLLFTIHYSIFTNYSFSQSVSISTSGSPADASSMLDISSTSKGLLIPRMSTAQRNGIPSPATSLLIFNTTTNCYESYVSGAWFSVSCPTPCSPPSSPPATANTSTATSIAWNWNSVSDATGYKWSTANNYANAADNGSSVSYTQTGLTCNTSCTLFVWAYNTCGNSASLALTQTTSSCGPPPCIWNNGNSFTVSHTARVNGAPLTRAVNYGQTQTSLTGESHCWITQNLGATRQATAPLDTTDAAAGWYWEFGSIQGYDWGTHLVPAWVDIGPFGATADWALANDPCNLLLGSGWRMPTYTEWNNAITIGNWNNYNDTYSSVLKIHIAGLIYTNGDLYGGRSHIGVYWSSTFYGGGNGWNMNLSSTVCKMYGNTLDIGRSLRCLRN